MKTLGERIKYAVRVSGLTQKEIADLIGIHPNTFTNWNKNEKEPGVNKMKLLAHFTGIDLVWLITGQNTGELARYKMNRDLSLIAAEDLPEYNKEETIAIMNDFLKLSAEHRRATFTHNSTPPFLYF